PVALRDPRAGCASRPLQLALHGGSLRPCIGPLRPDRMQHQGQVVLRAQSMLAAPCAVVLLMCAGCNNDEIPQWGPTATGDGSDDGTETGTDGGEPVPDPCWEPGGNFDPANPTLYQCVGEGSGELEFIICKNPFGCTASVAGVCDYDDVAEWTKMEPTVGPFTF